MSNKLFVGGLSWDTGDQSLQQAFESFGPVTEAKVITDRDTGRSRGFGFVTFQEGRDAATARQEMDGAELKGERLKVELSTKQGRGRDQDSNRKPGDWLCPQCRVNNFARRDVCFRCDAPKPRDGPAGARLSHSAQWHAASTPAAPLHHGGAPRFLVSLPVA